MRWSIAGHPREHHACDPRKQHANVPYLSQWYSPTVKRRYITMEQPRVLVVVDDLFFLTKIQTTLKYLGLAAQVLTQRAAIQAYVKAAVQPVLAVVDLTLRTDDAVDMISAIRATDSGA